MESELARVREALLTLSSAARQEAALTALSTIEEEWKAAHEAFDFISKNRGIGGFIADDTDRPTDEWEPYVAALRAERDSLQAELAEARAESARLRDELTQGLGPHPWGTKPMTPVEAYREGTKYNIDRLNTLEEAAREFLMADDEQSRERLWSLLTPPTGDGERDG